VAYKFNPLTGNLELVGGGSNVSVTDTNDIDLTLTGQDISATILSSAISTKTDKSSLEGTEEVLINDAGTLKRATTQNIGNLSTAKKSGITFGMNGSAISTGNKRKVTIPYACTITRVTLMAQEPSGSMVLDILKNGSSICASAKPTLVSDDYYNDATLTGWTLSIAAGDFLTWEVESISGITEFDVTLWVDKT
jgi:hypothetical protein